jgi:hypothetical protein
MPHAKNPFGAVGVGGHLDQYVDTNLTSKKKTGSVVRQPDPSGVASAGVIYIIHNPLCSSILPRSYKFEIQKAAHLRRSFSINDSVHLAPVCSVRRESRNEQFPSRIVT